MAVFDALNGQFAIPPVATIVAGEGGMAAVKVDTGETEGLVYLHGGHVARWRPKGQDEVLWLSGKSWYEAGKPIRGGVPVCFPWFGAKAGDAGAPAHGFVRLCDWRLDSIEHDGGVVTVVLQTSADRGSREWWDGEFVLTHRIVMGLDLAMSLEVRNVGGKELVAQEALHSYFAVEDVRGVRIQGLEGVGYMDKMDGGKVKQERSAGAGGIAIVGETDRVYLETAGAVTIEDQGKRRRIVVSKEGSRNTVVWNPWVGKAKAMADFGDEEWQAMVCVETCNVGEAAVRVRPGESAVMTARIGVERF